MGRWQESGAPAVPAAELRERLRQAEETLRAIRQGEVDAFVVARGGGPRVAVLEGAEHPYIALVEQINEGAMTLSSEGEIFYCNGFLSGLLGVPREQLVRSRFRDLVAPADRLAFDALLVEGLAGGGHAESTLLSRDGARRPVLLSLSPLTPVLERGPAPGRVRAGVIGIVTDLADQKAAEQRLEARVRQQAAIAELGQRALAGVSLNALFAKATHLVTHTLGAAVCEVTELLPDGKRLRIRGEASAPAGRPEVIFPVDPDSLPGLALRSGAPVIVDDVATDPRFSDRTLSGSRGMASAIAVLVPHGDAPFGVLEAASARPCRFTADDTHFLQAIANVLGAAIIRKRSEDLRRWLLGELTRARDGERRRLARELHDETGQSLWALAVGLGALETATGLDVAHGAAHRLHAIATRTLSDVGRLARGLHPGALDDHGLVAAATQYLHDFTASHHIAVEQVVENLDHGRLPPEVEITVYRILQEALTNVARHAQARSVRVTLRRAEAMVELIVADDGIGFRAEPVRSPMIPGGLGLHGMRERALMVGGELLVASRPGERTTVTARVPLPAAAYP